MVNQDVPWIGTGCKERMDKLALFSRVTEGEGQPDRSTSNDVYHR